MSSLHDFLYIADSFNLRYALLGAIAVNIWNPYRRTHDIDAAVDRADLLKLKESLVSLGYVLVENPRLEKFEFKHRKGDIDIYTDKVSGIDVSDLLTRAIEGELEGRRVKVVSPEDLILLKAKAGRERDMADISVILVNLRGNLDWSYLKEKASNLKIDLRSFLVRSLDRIPISVNNIPKVRKELRALIEEKL
jgi:hypothetical protein